MSSESPQPVPSKTVATVILQQLSLFGVKRIYGVVGDAIFGLIDALEEQESITFISVKHESVAAMMAAAEAKITGEIAVCIGQMGPGLGNLMNGIGDAYLDGSPVLVITGQAPTKKIGTSYKQLINQQEMVQAVTKFSKLVVHPDSVTEALVRAVHTAVAQSTVSHLSLPMDIFTMPTIKKPEEPTPLPMCTPITDQLKKAIQLMSAAKRPMLLMGNSARSIKNEIQQLADDWGCGIAMAYGASGIIPEGNPFRLGGLGEGGNPFLTDIFKQADVVLAIGTSWWPTGYTPKNAHVIQIQKIQEKLGNGIPVDCGLVGEMGAIITQLTERLATYTIKNEWIEQIQQCKEAWSIQNEIEGEVSTTPIHPSRIIRELEKHMDSNTIVALDEGDSTLWFMRNFLKECQHVVLSKHWRTMGAGLPAAMAAKLCLPDAQVICITGDGGLAMVLADLLTAVRYQLKITMVVFNNGTLQMERNKMILKHLNAAATQITNPNFVEVAKACGWSAQHVQSVDELATSIKEAVSSPKPYLLNVATAQANYPDYHIS